MILLADENLHRKIVERLEEAGHEVTHIADLAPSITDHEVLALAVERHALLITNDLDFGELVYGRGARHAGVLLLRLENMDWSNQAALVARALADHGEALRLAFSTLTESRLRIRG